MFQQLENLEVLIQLKEQPKSSRNCSMNGNQMKKNAMVFSRIRPQTLKRLLIYNWIQKLFIIYQGISLVRFWHENQQNTEDDEMMAGMLGGSCASHDLNLCVKQSFGKRKEDAVQCILEKCRRIIGHFKHSALANEELNLIQKEFCMDEHKLLQVLNLIQCIT